MPIRNSHGRPADFLVAHAILQVNPLSLKSFLGGDDFTLADLFHLYCAPLLAGADIDVMLRGLRVPQSSIVDAIQQFRTGAELLNGGRWEVQSLQATSKLDFQAVTKTNREDAEESAIPPIISLLWTRRLLTSATSIAIHTGGAQAVIGAITAPM
ncbi:hypothetical protein C8R44DRAFT_754084 [Mycena epipterygia]|nr:hypothetical protein C8R44DRAFT_754084 [Mycena epipterygia]